VPLVFLMMTAFSGAGGPPIAPSDASVPETYDACAWNVVPSPNVSPERNLLRAVAAVGTEAWAVGDYDADLGPNVNPHTLAIRWDGSAWSVVPSPNVGNGWNVLEAVTAIAADDLWAVGWSAPMTTGGTPQTLTLHGDGQTWELVDSPVLTGGSELLAIDAEGGEVWAVGDRAGPGDGSTGVASLAVRPSGSAWEVLPTPNLGSARNHLYAVDVIGPGDAWAVGRWRHVGETSRTFAIHWDGASWTHVPTPDPGLDGTLWDVEGAAADDVWAIGSFHNGTDYEAMTLHWDGTEWTVVANPGGGNAIAVAAGDDAWTMGTTVTHWDGSAWTPVAAPDSGGDVGAATVVGPCEGWAVGRVIDDAGVFTTLTWRLVGTPDLSTEPFPSDGVRVGPVTIGLGEDGRAIARVKPPIATPFVLRSLPGA
jgi:hypothetical protein